MTITNNRILHLDGFRAIAALLVLVYHALPGTKFNWLLGQGALLGVSMFFVLSGYLISQRYITAFLNDEPLPNIRNYLWRRILRIFPLFYVVLLTILIVTPIVHPYGFSSVSFSWPDILKHIFFIQILAPRTFIDTFLGNGWTLSVELLFYLTIPLLFWLLSQRSIVKEKRLPILVFVITVIGILSLIMRLNVQYDIEIYAWWQIFSYFSLFCLGMVVVLLSRSTLMRITSLRLPLLLFGLLLAVAVILFKQVFNPFDSEVLGLAFAMVMVSSLMGTSNVLVKFLAWSPIAYLGAISYGLYIWQQYLLYYAPYFHAFHLRVPMAFALVIGVSAITYHLIERPCLNLAAKLTSRRAKPALQLVEADAL